MKDQDFPIIWPLTALGALAIIGATISAWSSGTVPHDLVGIAIAIASYLMGLRTGEIRERLYHNGKGKPKEEHYE